jgi:hypothetical protein
VGAAISCIAFASLARVRGARQQSAPIDDEVRKQIFDGAQRFRTYATAGRDVERVGPDAFDGGGCVSIGATTRFPCPAKPEKCHVQSGPRISMWLIIPSSPITNPRVKAMVA